MGVKSIVAGLATVVLLHGSAFAAPAVDSVEVIAKEWETAKKDHKPSTEECLGWVRRCEAIAADPADPEAFKALTTVMNISWTRREDELQQALENARERMLQLFANDDEKMEVFLSRYTKGDKEWAERVFRATTAPGVKASCLYSRVEKTLRQMGMSAIEDDDAHEALRTLNEIQTNYGDSTGRRGQWAKVVDGDIFQLENLRIGMRAPEIEGEDLDGVSFKLSDYRGKVVVIDFWGNW